LKAAKGSSDWFVKCTTNSFPVTWVKGLYSAIGGGARGWTGERGDKEERLSNWGGGVTAGGKEGEAR